MACIEHKDVTTMCKLCRDKDKVVVRANDLTSADLADVKNRGYIHEESPIFVEFNGVGATEFKIWTEMEDFSDKLSDVSSQSENA